ncbi:helix-turn-helix transcriptional regulator [Streptomyces bobili]|uniref:helix-turn-helix transcriptional regulator n=1 Tax=Streptomyces bobili TaxID=67280 RepID=UPI0036ED5276
MPSAPPPIDWVTAERRRIGERIRAERLHANLTQEQVSLRSGVDRASVVRIEQGQQSPTLDTLIRLMVAIGVPLSRVVE